MQKLTNENYYSLESNQDYMSASQFKDFLKCEKEALAKVKGELAQEKTDPLLFGGYVDAYFSNELEQYKIDNPDMFNSRTGELKAPFKNIDEVISAIESDEILAHYVKGGEHQKIMVGEIGGVPFKIKMDSYFENQMIVDLKVIKDFELVWSEEEHRKVDFIENYGYAIQGAIYQEIVRQNTGLVLPFILAITTKQECPDKELIEIDQEYLDRSLKLVESLAPRYDLIKKGKVAPLGCGKCPTCRKGKKVKGVVSYKDFFNKPSLEESDENAF